MCGSMGGEEGRNGRKKLEKVRRIVLKPLCGILACGVNSEKESKQKLYCGAIIEESPCAQAKLKFNIL